MGGDGELENGEGAKPGHLGQDGLVLRPRGSPSCREGARGIWGHLG